MQYPDVRTGATAYEKYRSLKAKYILEKKREEGHYAAYKQTGSAADEAIPDFKSSWDLYNTYYECCVEGNMADEGEQINAGIIQRSSLPGMPDSDAAEEPGMPFFVAVMKAGKSVVDACLQACVNLCCKYVCQQVNISDAFCTSQGSRSASSPRNSAPMT